MPSMTYNNRALEYVQKYMRFGRPFTLPLPAAPAAPAQPAPPASDVGPFWSVLEPQNGATLIPIPLLIRPHSFTDLTGRGRVDRGQNMGRMRSSVSLAPPPAHSNMTSALKHDHHKHQKETTTLPTCSPVFVAFFTPYLAFLPPLLSPLLI